MARSATSFLRISTAIRDDLREFCKNNGLIMGTAASEILRKHIAVNGGNRLSKPIKQKRTKKAARKSRPIGRAKKGAIPRAGTAA